MKMKMMIVAPVGGFEIYYDVDCVLCILLTSICCFGMRS